MSITSEKINYIIRVGLHPALKGEGFIKSARTFRRTRPNCTQIVNIQGRWTNYKEEGQFTINLGVYYPEAARLHGQFKITHRPSFLDCMLHQRIGVLMPIRRDYWWDFDSKSDLDNIAKDVVVACMDFGLPWLEELSIFEGAIQFSRSLKIPFLAAIFSLLIEDRENAKKYLVDAIEKASPNLRFQTQMEKWGRSKGLIV
jgi:hypothetical protein